VVYRRHHILFFLLLLAAALPACSRKKAEITPKLSVNKKSAEMGTPIEMTYAFSTKPDYVALNKNLTVFVHFLDPKRVLRFQDDHQPPKPTSDWRPGGNYNYTRTVFIPRNIPAGEYRIAMGIYSPEQGQREVLDAKEFEHRTYDMGTLLIEIPPTEPVMQYSQGWYDPESTPGDISTRWRWTKKEAILKVRNPKADALLYANLDGVPSKFTEPQTVTITVNDHQIDSFKITRNEPEMKKYQVAKNLLGDGKMVDVKVAVDRTFIPADDKTSKDTRELGVRVYQLYLGKASD